MGEDEDEDNSARGTKRSAPDDDDGADDDAAAPPVDAPASPDARPNKKRTSASEPLLSEYERAGGVREPLRLSTA